MSAEKIYKIFVSSTFEDLREERAEVQKALLKLKCLPVGMELFPSTDEETWDFIQRQIEDSDYYIVIIAGRYGSAGPDGISFTEKEYDFAREIKKPTLTFIHGSREKIEVRKTDQDDDKRRRLEDFIRKVKNGPLVNFFSSPHELSAVVTTSLIDLRERRPAVGFIRADQAADLKKYAELLEENSKLRKELLEIQRDNIEIFPGSSDTFTSMLGIKKQDKNISVNPTYRDVAINSTWSELFIIVAENIVLRPSPDDRYMSRTICRHFCGELEERESPDWKSPKDFGEIKKRLYGLGLVNFENFAREPGSRVGISHQWYLTEYGQEQYGLLMGL